jgi:hypothetical protein
MRLEFNRGKFSVIPEMTFEELKKLSPLPATIATYDLQNNHKELTYEIIDGSLYGRFVREGLEEKKGAWWFFDPSVRTWTECEYPRCPAEDKR